MAGFLAMVLFTSAIQVVGSGISYNDDVNNEIDRRNTICQQLNDTNDQITKIDALLENLKGASAISAENDELISSLSDTFSATTNQITALQLQFRKKLLVILITNILIVAVISIYIINKTT